MHLSIHNLAAVVADLTPTCRGDCPVATVTDAVAGSLKCTALILVAHVLPGEDFADSRARAADYERRFRGAGT